MKKVSLGFIVVSLSQRLMSNPFMKYLFSILLFSFVSVNAQVKCDKYSKDYIPKNLNDAIDYLSCRWSEKDKVSFKSQPEKEAVTSLHFGTGMSIRNSWNLWKGKNALLRYFKSLDISHPDDISSIILTSFHRHLNGKDIDLSNQIQYYKDYWSKVNGIKDENNASFKSINNGDTVTVMFSKQKATLDKYSLAFLYNTASITDDDRCFVKGIVQNKFKKKGSRILTIQIIETKNCEKSYLGKTVIEEGEKIDYNMTYFYLQRN